MLERLNITPARYALIARTALVAFTLIVVTGVAVRVTGSGLGCPTWPKCTETSLYTELNTHGVIEFGNRMLTGFVTLAALLALLGAYRRRPYRRDLMRLAVLLPLGVVAQIVLGGFTVLYDLAPGFVMSHFMLSMLILVACVMLDWRARHEPEELAARRDGGSGDRLLTWGIRALIPLGALAILAGTAATAAGPHTGGTGTKDIVPRLDFKGAETLNFVIEQHARIATLLGIVAVALWILARRRGLARAARKPLTWLCVLLGLQGVIGGVQYQLELPAEIVWLHASLAATTWLAIVWVVVAAGELQARPARAPGTAGEAAPAS
ncbi:MAG: Heme A synthase, cytochrome oxidase biogenesis protein Cox15-CtaA [uncultured Solirubrobacteraceae bacterium]|uniref:Heme A synthase, cytochrome oxidase biogenesis protein Cox15-CtaA n=1 Tax=uncultured Solirubrobacteraceae bacterium TaxID=1162706 RepID=A0A6J4TSS2_9ACTN|nr:MAG: Heme A synthase, cytochrome oxidase biogenesis protein Cox15-CtaA [uncultured Solirubrobacteraceae bacterium]